ncbi:uncharacterized protein LOC121858943 [Homarus americanus]|uniref:uncharacterized protein LOC121858943 n=1 Tax=Homarus americanus TaxID=6706 RepID=UPI001C4706DB|nr:uncharacterized protein LOC121858943 [Homarus americanus]
MAANNPGECSVCLDSYNERERRPRSLPCGHAFCSSCVTDLIKRDKLTCPSCRVSHKATSTSQFPICYGMEGLIRALKVHQVAPTAAEQGVDENLRSLLQEQDYSMDALDEVYQHLLDQLSMYESELAHRQDDHQGLITKLQELMEQNQAITRLLKDEQDSVEAVMKDIDDRRNQGHILKACLALVTTTQEAHAVRQDFYTYKLSTQDLVHTYQQQFPDVDVLYRSLRVRESSKRTAAMMTGGTDGEGVASIHQLPPSHISIMDKVNHITLLARVSQTTPLSLEELRPLIGPARILVEAGWVVAVQGHLRCSTITLQDSQLHLHTLRTRPTPNNARTLEHRAVMGLVDPTSTLVFLDLGWGGSTKGTVYIRLSPDNGLARQFLLLCTGERGPSYAGTRMLEVYNKGKPGERVCGGDYDNVGEGVARLLPGLQVGPEYRKTPTAGTVRAEYGPASDNNAQFCIFTRDADWKISFAFGHVERGLQVVRSAVKHSNIKEVTVVNCGVVLPL